MFWVQNVVILNLAALLMTAAMGVMFYEASTRTLVGRSHWWAEEAVRFLVVWSVLMSIGIASRNGHFIRMDLLLHALPRRFTLISAVLSSVAGLIFSGFLVYAGYNHVAHLYKIGMMTQSSLDLPLWLVRLILPICGVFYFTYFAVCLAEALAGRDPFAANGDEPTGAIELSENTER